MLRAEWTPSCDCVRGEPLASGMVPIFFTTENEAMLEWLAARSNNNPHYAAHARGRGHLLTVHVPHVCCCSDCSPEFYR